MVHWAEVDYENTKVDQWFQHLALEEDGPLPLPQGEPHGLDQGEDPVPGEEVPAVPAADDSRPLPLQRRFRLQRLLQRAHEGLGHPHQDRFLRILRYAKASPEIIKEAKALSCSVCARHQAMKPARRAAPPREIGINDIVGIDVIYLPTRNPNRSRPALNIIDWCTKFQMVLPLRSKRPEEARGAYRQWLRFWTTQDCGG